MRQNGCILLLAGVTFPPTSRATSWFSLERWVVTAQVNVVVACFAQNGVFRSRAILVADQTRGRRFNELDFDDLAIHDCHEAAAWVAIHTEKAVY